MKMIVMAALALGACATTNSAPAGGKCDATAVQNLVGKPLAANEADAKKRAGAAAVRSYGPGAALTMDYREDRLNIETDEAGTIVKLSCG
ncbi:I78 family peptidase inhibitor [Sphingomonas jeddahensis]|uniref:Peptidase inhibitor I78 family protein n=1 Tax=Sphingomonas jeddahensis TaxID=1915074 RepID=A0A1V2EYE7_9SPHN|nr:I78 family peptidase inhibitor [Sphingomonas jeddahensis]ONF97537.1 Peptidase inhibitor I78 family protein [Sphingomonas jeddahensis]